MGVSINWLKQYVDINWSPAQLAHNLTMAGIAIEGVEETNDDAIMELDLTPNRGDCMGLINLAREIAALNGADLRIPAIELKENGEDISKYIDVKIEAPDLCLRYAARVIKNVTIKESPLWMQERLLSAGIRPINNVVDVTNYVLLEDNQPLHAFDYDLLGENREIVVRKARDGEKFTTLDDVERELSSDMLVITDGQKPVALAGIMGGQNTEINDNTTTVLLESACFLGPNIRRSSKKLGLRSDSSVRFEKGTDINGVIFAINRAASLIQETAGGEIVAGICDNYPSPQAPKRILLRPDRVNYLLGTNISSEEVLEYLHKLRFKTNVMDNYLAVEVPTYRPDIEMEVDLIEEVARLYGYDKIPSSLPSGPVSPGGLNAKQKFMDKIGDILSARMHEVINYSFISPSWFDRLLLADNSSMRSVIAIANPLSEEQSVMRTMLLPGLLDDVSRNMAKKNNNLAFYELGKVFYPTTHGLPEEKLKLAAITAGTTDVNWLKHKVEMDFFYLKGILEELLFGLGIRDFEMESCVAEGYHPGRTANVKVKNKNLGILGEVHPQVLQNFGIKVKACAFELDVQTLFEMAQDSALMQEIAKYPPVERDIALILKNEINVAEVIKVIREEETSLLNDIVVFDVYSGDQVAAGHKSIALKLILQSKDKTLVDEEVNKVIYNIINALKTKLEAELR
jgi:phenylalanyl-tRNA synthetase beta chain